MSELTIPQIEEIAAKNFAHQQIQPITVDDLCQTALSAIRERDSLKSQLNTPELHDFSAAVVSEAQHQRHRWGSDHDTGKEPQDWFWLLGYLGGKALKAHASGDIEKALHHAISSAAVLANWHAAICGTPARCPRFRQRWRSWFIFPGAGGSSTPLHHGSRSRPQYRRLSFRAFRTFR